MKNYFVDGNTGWFVVLAKSKAEAKAEGLAEFGRGGVDVVRPATEKETGKYLFEKGIKKLTPL